MREAREVLARAALLRHHGAAPFDEQYPSVQRKLLDDADADLAALAAAGLAVVPREATEAMLDAGASPGWSRFETRGRWRAMLAAAEKPDGS